MHPIDSLEDAGSNIRTSYEKGQLDALMGDDKSALKHYGEASSSVVIAVGAKGVGKGLKTAKKTLGKKDASRSKSINQIDEEIETTGELVYRGDMNDKVFEEGFISKGESEDLLLHAIDSNNPKSNYISTTKDFKQAIPFATKNFSEEGYIYIIDKPKYNTYDAIDSNNPKSNYISTTKDFKQAIPFATKNFSEEGYIYIIDKPKYNTYDINEILGKYSPHPNEQEIAIKNKIDTKYIKGRIKIKSDGKLNNFSEINPNYNKRLKNE